MTVSSAVSRVVYAENGVSTSYPVNFRFLAAGDLSVVRIDAAGNQTVLLLNIDYRVTGGGDGPGGTVLTALPGPAGGSLVIKRATSRLQPVDFTPFDPFPAETQERIADRAMMALQEDSDTFARAMLVPDGETAPALPPAAQRTGYAAWVSGGLVGATLPPGTTAAQTVVVNTRTSMAALASPVAGQLLFLAESGRQGLFMVVAGTAPADTAQGLYVPSVVTGFYYARQWDGITGRPEWFGAVPGGADCLAALQACLALCPVTLLANDDYYISAAWRISTSQRAVVGRRGRPLARGQGTRLIVISATADVLQIGAATYPGTIAAMPRDITIDGVAVARDRSPSMADMTPNNATGVRVTFAQNVELAHVFAAEHALGFYYNGTVACRVQDCRAYRTVVGVGTADFWRGHYADGTPNIGLAGGNSGLFLDKCSAETSLTFVGGIDGLTCFGAFAGTYVRDFKSSGARRGAVVSGTGTSGAIGTNIDLQIEHGVFDGCADKGIEVQSVAPGGIVKIVNPFVAIAGSTSNYGIYIHDGDGTVAIEGGQTICTANGQAGGTAIGIFAQSQNGLSIVGNVVAESKRPISLTSCKRFRLEATVRNLTVVPSEGGVFVSASSLGYINAAIEGAPAELPVGVELTGSSNATIEVDCTLIDLSAITGGGPNKLKVNGLSITAAGLYTSAGASSGSGTILASGIVGGSGSGGGGGGGGGALTVSIAPTFLYAEGSTTAFNTSSATATVTGGTAPYTGGWTISGKSGTGTVTANSPAAATSNFHIAGLPAGGDTTAFATYSGTDAVGAVFSAAIPLEFDRSGGGGVDLR